MTEGGRLQDVQRLLELYADACSRFDGSKEVDAEIDARKAALDAALVALAADRERLDWLEAKRHDVEFYEAQGIADLKKPEPERHRVAIVLSDDYHEVAPTLRAAIDAARGAAPGENILGDDDTEGEARSVNRTRKVAQPMPQEVK